MFGDKLSEVDGDSLVVYETGEVMESGCGFRQHQYYMYLKARDVYTVDLNFDVKAMQCRTPLGRPLRRKYSLTYM